MVLAIPVIELKSLTRELKEMVGGAFFEPENSLHAEQFWWQVKVKELLKLAYRFPANQFVSC